MNYKILPTKEFSSGFKKVNNQLQQRIKSKIKEVAENPLRYKQLHYDLSSSCRIWIGKHQINLTSQQPDKVA